MVDGQRRYVRIMESKFTIDNILQLPKVPKLDVHICSQCQLTYGCSTPAPLQLLPTHSGTRATGAHASSCTSTVSPQQEQVKKTLLRGPPKLISIEAVECLENYSDCSDDASNKCCGDDDSTPPPPSTSMVSTDDHTVSSQKKNVPKKSRTAFTKYQLQILRKKFDEQKYLTKLDRTALASAVGLTEKHIKTWFQNRRTKWKKDCSEKDWSKHKEHAATLMYNQFIDNKNKKDYDDDDDEESVIDNN